ncbi:MAG: nickel pincer cofactor biosynthesis protein LarC [Nitrospiraceae bacterium]
MTRLHFDCFSGISGDMTLGALIDAGLPLKDLARALQGVPVRGYRLRSAQVMRGGLHATKVDVLIRGEFHSPFSLRRIHRMIAASRIPAAVKEQSSEVFERLAEAEGVAHRVSPSEVRFHEVGVIDSFVDVIGSLLGCHLLGITRMTASAVNVGGGLIESSHGTLPAPGPAVAAMARGIPVYSSGPSRELTTPTGIALLRTVVEEFVPLPLMRPHVIGHGAGGADTGDWPNVLRVFVGDSVLSAEHDTIVEIETNVDDLNPQAYETVMERLFAAGAVDVTLTPVIMKHGRPGIILAALVSPPKAHGVADLMLRETSTLGVRMQELSRHILPRRVEEIQTKHGAIRVKVADLGQGRSKGTPEYADCKRIAQHTGRPVREIMEDAALAYRMRKRNAKVKMKNDK